MFGLRTAFCRRLISTTTSSRTTVVRNICTANPAEPPSGTTKTIAEQNEERARLYLEKYASQGDAQLTPHRTSPTAPPKKRIPVVTGDVPDAAVIAVRLEAAHGAHDVATLDVRSKAPFADWLVVCCGRTERHVMAIADGIKDDMRRAGVRVDGDVVGICGKDDPNWMAVDVGHVVVHVMTDEARQRYDLEGLWMPDRVEEEADVEDVEDVEK